MNKIPCSGLGRRPRKMAMVVAAAAIFLLSNGLRAEMVGSLLLQPESGLAPSASPSIIVQSAEQGEEVRAEVLGSTGYPFGEVAKALVDPANWCDLVPLHPNVKACTWEGAGSQVNLAIYVGRKFFQPPSEAALLAYRFQIREKREDYLHIVLTAAEGPLATRDYRLELEGFPDQDGTFLLFRLAYRTSRVSRLVTRGYLATLGRDKVGFSCIGIKDGKPVYIGGLRGIIERNAMRYFLAMRAFMDTRGLPAAEIAEARLQAWFDLTEKYPQQLYELAREEYLEIKRLERREQERLQAGGAPPAFR